MMRLAIVAEWLRPEGGVTRSLLQLLRALDPADVDVTVLLLRDDGDLRALIPDHVRVIDHLGTFAYRSPASAVRTVLSVHGLAQAVRLAAHIVKGRMNGDNVARLRFLARLIGKGTEQFDVVASYAMLDALSNYVASEGIDADRRVMWCHIDASLYDRRELERLVDVYARFDRINCVGENTRRALAEIHPSLAGRMRVFHNLVDRNAIITASREATALPTYDGTLLCTVARLTPEKGVDLAVQAAALLAQAGIDFTWWIVGPAFNAEYASEVRALISRHGLEQRVRLLGETLNPYPFMAACDIYVQPSRVEGYCGSTVEAKALGKPVIRTAIPDAHEQFTHNVNGSIVPLSAHALQQEITRLITNPSIRERYSQSLVADCDIAANPVMSAFI